MFHNSLPPDDHINCFFQYCIPLLVPWPLVMRSMKYIGINHSLHFQGGSSPHIGTKTSKHKRGQNPEKEEETSYGSFLLSSLGPWHYVIYLTNGAQHYILALNLSIYHVLKDDYLSLHGIIFELGPFLCHLEAILLLFNASCFECCGTWQDQMIWWLWAHGCTSFAIKWMS